MLGPCDSVSGGGERDIRGSHDDDATMRRCDFYRSCFVSSRLVWSESGMRVEQERCDRDSAKCEAIQGKARMADQGPVNQNI